MSERHGSENRQRARVVLVRLNPDEYGALDLTSKQTGKSRARLLRDAFLSTVASHPAPAGQETRNV